MYVHIVAYNLSANLQSLLDEEGLGKVNTVSQEVEEALKAGNYLEATMLWSSAESLIEEASLQSSNHMVL